MFYLSTKMSIIELSAKVPTVVALMLHNYDYNLHISHVIEIYNIAEGNVFTKLTV